MSMASEATPVDVHDLNNMLAAIMISATILEREDGASEIRRRHAGHILRATEGAVRLLDGLGTRRNASPVAPEAAPKSVAAPSLAPTGPAMNARTNATAQTRVVVPMRDAPLQGISMLLVEDEPTLAAVLDTWLTRRGATVFRAGDIRGALATLRQMARCDVILSDYHLPDGTGLELACHVARLSPGHGLMAPLASGHHRSQIPLCLMTAGCLPANASPGPGSPIAHSVAKPIDLAALTRALRALAYGDGIFACAS